MWQYNDIYVSNEEVDSNSLEHYGVPGMKWGITRAKYKANRMYKLNKKIAKYDKKSAKYYKKAEQIHSSNDLQVSNKKAKKAAKHYKKSAKFHKKATKSLNDGNQNKYLKFETKSEKHKYLASKKTIDANRLSRMASYSRKAMRYAIKSDIAKKKSAKGKYLLTKDEQYIYLINKRIDTHNSMYKNKYIKNIEYRN